MAKGAVRDVSDAQLPRSVNQAVGLVQSLKGRVFCLQSVDLGNWTGSSQHSIQFWDPSFQARTRVGFSECRGGAFREADVPRLSGLADLVESRDRLLQRGIYHVACQSRFNSTNGSKS